MLRLESGGGDGNMGEDKGGELIDLLQKHDKG